MDIVTVYFFCIIFSGVGDRMTRKYLHMYNHIIMYRCVMDMMRYFLLMCMCMVSKSGRVFTK